jgi:aryl-alcohol dehydrogenase-like predicted oxidoreductase
VSERIALGTVQFGLDYGIANESGQVSRNEGARILEVARSGGVDTLDTAVAYGESESRLGEIGVAGWRIVSKLPPLPKDVVDVAEWVRTSTRGSLDRLKVPVLGGLLLHRSADLAERGTELHGALLALRADGVVEKIGVSIYHPSELDAISRHEIDLVQAPFNVLDRRLAASGWLKRLRDRGVELHTRSTFLQGLLLMPPGKRPARFHRWDALWRRWDAYLREHDTSALAASLGFVLGAGVDRVVVGVDSANQLQEILVAASKNVRGIPDDLSSDDLDLISPVNWSTK